MSWPMMGMFGRSQHQVEDDDDVDVDGEEDFYGITGDDTRGGAGEGEEEDINGGDLLSSIMSGHVFAPAAAVPPKTPQPKFENGMSPEEKKAENMKTAQRLRAQLLAKRQNTPIKAATPRAETPAKDTPQPAKPPTPVPVQFQQTFAKTAQPVMVPSIDAPGIDALIAEGRRDAEAKADAQPNPAINGHVKPTIDQPKAATNGHPLPQRPTHSPPEIPTAPTAPTPHFHPNKPPAEQSHPSALSNAYYADLSAWLELTGYHDLAYRTAKLKSRRERQATEDEIARLQAKLDQLAQQDEADMIDLRASIGTAPSTTRQFVPPLPEKMPNAADLNTMAKVAAHLSSGPSAHKKRPHSPPPQPAEKNARPRGPTAVENGFRIRGAQQNGHTAGNASSPNSFPSVNGTATTNLERRISYPSPRGEPRGRGSPNDRGGRGGSRSRDPSLERRQSHYRRDGRDIRDDAARYENDHYQPARDHPARDHPARGSYGGGGRGRAPPPRYGNVSASYRGR